MCSGSEKAARGENVPRIMAASIRPVDWWE